jgi:hypothetical protein
MRLTKEAGALQDEVSRLETRWLELAEQTG